MITFDATTILCIVLIVAQAGVIIYFIRNNRKKAKKTAGNTALTPEQTYTQLRQLALQVTPDQLKLAIPNRDLFVYGMVMDWSMGEVVVTLVAYITGACSMYISTGGGFIKGGQNPEVAEAAVEFVTAAKDFIDTAAATTSNLLPQSHQVNFYFLTNHKMFAASEEQTRFEDETSPLNKLFKKANEVINLMRNSGNGSLAN